MKIGLAVVQLVRIPACHLVASDETGSSPVRTATKPHRNVGLFWFVYYLVRHGILDGFEDFRATPPVFRYSIIVYEDFRATPLRWDI